MSKFNFKNNNFLVLDKDIILNRRLNLDIAYFFKFYRPEIKRELEENLKEKINYLYSQVQEPNKEVLELLSKVDFSLLYELKEKYGFEFVEFSTSQQIKDIIPVLELMCSENAQHLSVNGTLGLSFIQDGPNTAYYTRGFSQKYLDKLHPTIRDYNLEREINGQISELITSAYIVGQSDISPSDSVALSSYISEALDISMQNLHILKERPKLASPSQIRKDTDINRDIEDKVLIEIGGQNTDRYTALNQDNIERIRDLSYGKNRLSRLH